MANHEHSFLPQADGELANDRSPQDIFGTNQEPLLQDEALFDLYANEYNHILRTSLLNRKWMTVQRRISVIHTDVYLPVSEVKYISRDGSSKNKEFSFALHGNVFDLPELLSEEPHSLKNVKDILDHYDYLLEKCTDVFLYSYNDHEVTSDQADSNVTVGYQHFLGEIEKELSHYNRGEEANNPVFDQIALFLRGKEGVRALQKTVLLKNSHASLASILPDTYILPKNVNFPSLYRFLSVAINGSTDFGKQFYSVALAYEALEKIQTEIKNSPYFQDLCDDNFEEGFLHPQTLLKTDQQFEAYATSRLYLDALGVSLRIAISSGRSPSEVESFSNRLKNVHTSFATFLIHVVEKQQGMLSPNNPPDIEEQLTSSMIASRQLISVLPEGQQQMALVKFWRFFDTAGSFALGNTAYQGVKDQLMQKFTAEPVKKKRWWSRNK